tara:strand:- start:749 stop:1087 length:339 start_codon:yes stop_codon:yes gene_type:complete
MIKVCKTNTDMFQDPLAEESTGVFMKFNNGNTISIQWGRGTYSSHRSNPRPLSSTATAEVLLSNDIQNEDFLNPLGWCDSDMVAELIHQASTMTWEELTNKYNEEVEVRDED